MYFTFGWPKTYCSGIGENFIEVEHSLDSSLIAFIGTSSVSIWSGDQHRIQLGFIIRSDDSLSKFGRNEKICWSPDSSSIAIVTNLGYILVYRIEKEAIDVLQFKFYKDHHSPYLLHDKRKVSIKFSSSFKPSTLGALCITGNNEYIYIFTREGYLVKSSWTGELISQFSLDIVPFDVTSVFYNPSFAIFGLVFENGSSAILKKRSKDRLRGYWLSKENSVSISLNLKHRLAAVGLKNGDVLIYKLPGPILIPKPSTTVTNATTTTTNLNSSLYCQYLRTFSLTQFREITPETIGPISKMKWTGDGHCLAVGWRNRGFCLWSVYGCKLTCTIPQMNDMTFSNRFLEPCKEGVLSFSWGPEGYHLVILSNGNELGEYLQFTFLKASLASNPNLNYSERIILQTEDRLMLLNYKGKESGDIRWKHLQIPSAYLNDNWPIKHIALSRDKSQYAVAGKRGIILYNSLSKRWKMFGDRNQEQEIESFGLAWYRTIIIVANLNGTTKKFEFLFYPKQHLDNSSLLYKMNLPQNHTPLLVDCNDSHLALLTTDSFLYLYRVLERNDKIELSLVHLLSMAVPSPPLSISLLPPIYFKSTTNLSQSTSSTNLFSQTLDNTSTISTTTTIENSPRSKSTTTNFVYCLILYSSGKLCLSNAETATYYELSDNIEQYWFTNIYRDKELIGNTLWAYGKSGIKVWFPFTSEEIHSTKNLHHNRSLSFDNEVYPISLLNELGVIVGLSQGLSYSSCSAYPNYEIHIKTHPFLHSILKHLLDRGSVEKAWSLSSRFYTIPHFTHSLELLLHETISESDKTFSKLEYVINFLKKFPQFPEVSMRCSRKIDATLWKSLFKVIGDPVALYQKCLNGGRIEIAASYLKILQNLIGYDFSRKCAIDLLEIVLDFDNIELAGDLVRFLEISEDEEQQDELDKVQLERDSDPILKQMDTILSGYSSKLLKSKLLRNFLLFSRKTMCDMSGWLVKEKRSTILRTVEDLDMALNSIHVQFYINLPTEPQTFSAASVISAFSPTPSHTPLNMSSSSIQLEEEANNDNFIQDIITTKDEIIESLKSRIQMIGGSGSGEMDHHRLYKNTHSNSSNSSGHSNTNHVYSFKSHQFMVAPITSNIDFNDPSFLKDSIDSSMDDLYFLLQELTTNRCYEWILIIATVLLNPILITKTLRKIPSIYENYCKMLSLQKE
eukprot:gene2348-2896_t